MPVLTLTAHGQEADKVRGFRLGADDYVTKPFGVLELMARLGALLWRTSRRPQRLDARESFGDIEIDPATRTIRRRGRIVPVTPMELDLLIALVRRRGAVASRLELLQEVWGHSAAVLTRTVDTHIAELRRKLEDDPALPRHILTVRKAGYRLDAGEGGSGALDVAHGPGAC
jgi:DNA-binding response OmpR family regulator